MKEFYGVILLDQTEIILRVYQISEQKWNLLHYFSKNITSDLPASAIIAIIAEILSLSYTQKILDWKLCSRNIPDSTITQVAKATGLKIEALPLHREQELLCKGVFTETW
jgi:hypothetical protein